LVVLLLKLQLQKGVLVIVGVFLLVVGRLELKNLVLKRVLRTDVGVLVIVRFYFVFERVHLILLLLLVKQAGEILVILLLLKSIYRLMNRLVLQMRLLRTTRPKTLFFLINLLLLLLHMRNIFALLVLLLHLVVVRMRRILVLGLNIRLRRLLHIIVHVFIMQLSLIVLLEELGVNRILAGLLEVFRLQAT
jgi:hypothetical protein